MVEEWENDDDVGYYSLTVSLEEFLSMETLSLRRLSESNGMPLDMFACDLWRSASDAMHECCDPERVAMDGEVDGEMEGEMEEVEEMEEMEEVEEVEEVVVENYQEENEEFELTEDYYHYQKETFVGLLCKMEIEVRNFFCLLLLLLLLFVVFFWLRLFLLLTFVLDSSTDSSTGAKFSRRTSPSDGVRLLADDQEGRAERRAGGRRESSSRS